MIIFLVRHGQSMGNVKFYQEGRPKNDPLTELGKTQAELVADALSKQTTPPEVIYTSPYTRALNSAEIIKNKINAPLFEDQRLGEYFPGDWDGLHEEFFIEKFAKIPEHDRITFRPPNGESWLDEALRFNAVIERAENENYSSAVFVSHYDPIKAVVNLLTKLTPGKWNNPAEYPTGSLTILASENDTWSVVDKLCLDPDN